MLTNQQIETIVKRVFEWNRIAGNKAGWINFKLELDLFKEEYGETLSALKKKDVIECLDGVVDCFIVAIGTGYKAGYSVDEVTEIIEEEIDRMVFHDEYEYYRYEMESYRVELGHAMSTSIYLFTKIENKIQNLYGAFLHILDSNDSKFIKNDKGELVAIKDEAGKIQKGPDYFKPDLTPFIKKNTP